MPILRGEIYFLEIGPTRGRELNDKRRPVVVLSVNDTNVKPLVVVGIPGTTFHGQRVFVNDVKVVPSSQNGLTSPTVFKCLQIKALDHSRFDRVRAGVLAAEDLMALEKAIKICLGLT
jgi:mRNA interferase MazF